MGGNKPRDRLSQKDKIKQITEQLEAGVAAVFESDAYKSYLQCINKYLDRPQRQHDRNMEAR